MESELRRTAEDGDLVVAVTDPETRIQWTYGGRVMRRKAESVNFVAGARWDDRSAGTNALDLANRLDAPSMVFSAEHYASIVHNWVCWAAPLHDPVTGRQLGVLDLSTTWDRTHPIGMATARVMARLIEGAMPHTHHDPAAALLEETGDPGLVMTLLGTAESRLDGQRLLLNRRQTEVLALLALHPGGLSLEQLHAMVYGDQAVTFSTLKAEVSHLRAALGGQLSSRPYRLLMPVATDVEQVLALLRRGQVRAAVDATAATCCPAPPPRPSASWGSTSRSPCARPSWPTPSPTRCCATASSRPTTPRWSSAAWRRCRRSPAPTPRCRCSRAASPPPTADPSRMRRPAGGQPSTNQTDLA